MYTIKAFLFITEGNTWVLPLCRIPCQTPWKWAHLFSATTLWDRHCFLLIGAQQGGKLRFKYWGYGGGGGFPCSGVFGVQGRTQEQGAVMNKVGRHQHAQVTGFSSPPGAQGSDGRKRRKGWKERQSSYLRGWGLEWKIYNAFCRQRQSAQVSGQYHTLVGTAGCGKQIFPTLLLRALVLDQWFSNFSQDPFYIFKNSWEAQRALDYVAYTF